MSEKKVLKPVALAVGAALAGSFAFGSVANAEPGANPFAMNSLSSGYMLTVGEGSCGGDKEDGMKDNKDAEASCGGDKDAEASCGGDKKDGMDHDKDAEASCGGDKKDGMDHDKDAEASCGGDKDAEASCGGDKKG